METAAEATRTLGPYRTVRLLGAGGTGRVYLAERLQFAQRVAVKCFFPDFVSGGLAPESLGLEGQGEQDLLTLLDHPNIVRLIDGGVAADGTRYLAMEYVDGLSIAEHADARRMTVEARLRLMLPVLEAVEYAHRHLVVHCDLKPANVLVTMEGQPKLLDFGTAGRVGGRATSLTRVYASPEQQFGGVVTVASDVYALGLLLREVVAGVGPEAPRDAAWPATAAAAELRSGSVAALRSQLRGDLPAIARKALAERPEDRYGSVGEMRADLERHLEGRPIAARATGAAERAWLWVRRHRLAAAMAAVLLVLLAASAGGVAWKAAVAAHERTVAERRLEDLVRMNGSLAGDLYGSVAQLPGSAAARASLLAGATETLNSVSATGTHDPALALELARQFEQVARLQAASGDSAAARVSLQKGIAVLNRDTMSAANRAELERLRAAAGPQPQ